MSLNPLPQYKFYGYKNDFIGNSGSQNIDMQKNQMLTQYLHVSDRATEPAKTVLNMTNCTRFIQCSAWYETALLRVKILEKFK